MNSLSPKGSDSTESIPHVCRRCKTSYPNFQARCTSCNTWNVIVPLLGASDLAMPARALAGLGPLKLLPTGLNAWNKVMGGIFPGGVYLLGAEPGTGKSSCCLQLLGSWQHGPTLYLSTEETRESVALRALRFGYPDVPILSESSLDKILDVVSQLGPDTLVAVDSLQKIDVHGASMGGTTALKAAVEGLKRARERSNSTLLIISHVTKDEDFAGPKTVEHDVDACAMMFHYGRARVLRCEKKNRFAAAGRAGWMQMTAEGLVDASPDLILPPATLPGRVLTITPQGLPAEVQAQYKGQIGGLSIGVSDERAAMVCSVLGAPKSGLYLRADGTDLEHDPSCDLPIALAILSALHSTPLDQRTVAWGQLTLDGRLLPGAHHDARREAAEDLELTPILSPDIHKTLEDVMDALDLIGVPELPDEDNPE